MPPLSHCIQRTAFGHFGPGTDVGERPRQTVWMRTRDYDMLEVSRILTAAGWAMFGVGVTVYGIGISVNGAGNFEETVGLVLAVLGLVAMVVGWFMFRQQVED